MILLIPDRKIQVHLVESHLLENTENHWDLLCVEKFLRHQRQAGFGISLQFIIAVIVLNWSNLEQKGREMIGEKARLQISAVNEGFSP